jgi:hypothetical protein
MKTRTVVRAGLELLVVALTLLLAKTYWQAPPAGNAWSLDEPDQLVSTPTNGGPLHAAFRLRNNSSRPLRVLGSNAC